MPTLAAAPPQAAASEAQTGELEPRERGAFFEWEPTAMMPRMGRGVMIEMPVISLLGQHEVLQRALIPVHGARRWTLKKAW